MPSGKDHLHIICSDPIYHPVKGCDCVLIVNITSVPHSGYYDSSCVFGIGDHDFIRHRSYAYYAMSVLWRAPLISSRNL